MSLGLAWGAGTFSRRGRERLSFLLPVIAALLLMGRESAPSDDGGSAAATPVGPHFALDELLVMDEVGFRVVRELAP